MQHDHVLKKLNFDPKGLRGGGGLQAKLSLPCCCIRGSLKFNMRHDHVLKKVDFDPGSGGGGSSGKIIAAMLLHSRFPLI